MIKKDINLIIDEIIKHNISSDITDFFGNVDTYDEFLSFAVECGIDEIEISLINEIAAFLYSEKNCLIDKYDLVDFEEDDDSEYTSEFDEILDKLPKVLAEKFIDEIFDDYEKELKYKNKKKIFYIDDRFELGTAFFGDLLLETLANNFAGTIYSNCDIDDFDSSAFIECADTLQTVSDFSNSSRSDLICFVDDDMGDFKIWDILEVCDFYRPTSDFCSFVFSFYENDVDGCVFCELGHFIDEEKHCKVFCSSSVLDLITDLACFIQDISYNHFKWSDD